MARAVPIEEVSMIKLVLRTLLAAGGIAAAAVVGAAPITYAFTGIITSDAAGGGSIGHSFLGSITLDPTKLLGTSITDNQTINYKNDTYFFPQSSPLDAFGNASSTNFSLAIGGGNSSDFVQTAYNKNAFGFGQNQIAAQILSISQNGNVVTNTATQFSLRDTLGENSPNFTAWLANVDFYQELEWTASDSDLSLNTYFDAYDIEFDTVTGEQKTFVSVSGYLTSVKKSFSTASQVPEPPALALLSLGLAGIALSRRRKR